MVLRAFFAFTLAMFVSSSAWAIEVHVTTNEWDTQWYWAPVGGQFATERGDATIDVPEGEFDIRLEWVAGVRCHVDADGNVTVVSPADAGLVGGPNSLEFIPVPIAIQASGHDPRYVAPGVGYLSGDDTAWVVPGTSGHYVIAVDFATQGAGARFTTDGAGNVSPVNDSSGDDNESIVGGFRTLSFKTTPVTIDPHAFEGALAFINNPSWFGLRTLHLMKSTAMSLRTGYDTVQFEIDATGNVTSRNTAAATGDGATLNLKNANVTVDPGIYDSVYHLLRRESENYWTGGGVRNYVLVPGIRWGIRLSSTSFNFDLAADGTLSGPNSNTFDYDGSTLRIRTVPVTIDAGDFLHAWGPTFRSSGYPTSSHGRFIGSETFDLPPGTRWGFRVHGASNVMVLTIDSVGAVGDVSPAVADIVGNTATFRTVNIAIDPGSYTDRWNFLGGTAPGSTLGWYGAQTFSVVPGFDYRITNTGGGAPKFFSVFEPCAVTPGTVTTDNASFDLSCDVAPADSDGDGVPDEADNCVDVGNADQIDVDEDGLGDVCDDDLDGDGVLNHADNCPELPNADQADLDADGDGDACDTDSDGDSVPDEDDNCPVTANTDQGDNDGDGSGDVCDPDDDEDGVYDLEDNCPLVANPSQSDADGDAIGDACDADTDGDGVANEDDRCAESPGGSPVNAEGCNGAQLIDLRCDPDAFATHGRFVACVAKTAKEAVDAGLISNQDRARHIREAARANGR